MTLIQPQTPRLQLRQWQASDYAAFAALNADPAVMAHFPATLTRQESDALLERASHAIATQGWGMWAVERLDNHQFIGFVGLNQPTFELPCSPCVEVGWRLAQAHWGQGYAPEAARAALAVGFDLLGLDEIVSFTALENAKSIAVMHKLGMQRDAKTFEHPKIAPGHRLRTHCLYRLSVQNFKAQVKTYS